MIRIALFGYGQFGKSIESIASQYNSICSSIIYRDTALEDLDPNKIDICIDVALCEGLEERAFWALNHQKPLIIGTTGWDIKKSPIIPYAQKIGASLVWSSNYSLGVWIFRNILKKSIEYVKNFPQYELGLFEAHHSKKRDAPSGTLLSIQEDIKKELDGNVSFRSSSSEKNIEVKKNEYRSIDVSTLRTGHIPGTHMLLIDGLEESIEITHISRSRTNFAHGIFTALSLMQKYPGVWEFSELLEKELLINEADQ